MQTIDETRTFLEAYGLEEFKVDIVVRRGMPAIRNTFDGDFDAFSGKILSALAALAASLEDHRVLPVFRDKLPRALLNCGTALDIEHIEAVCDHLSPAYSKPKLNEARPALAPLPTHIANG